MVVSKNLLSSFERSRDVHLDKLDYLLSIGVHPEFAEKCALMFAQYGVTTEEIIGQKDNILAANDDIYKVDIKRSRLQRKAVVDYSSLKMSE